VTVLFLAINYRSEPDTLRLLADLQRQDPGASWVAGVVDNTSTTIPTPALQKAAAEDPRIRYLDPKANLGYFGGAAWGLEQLRSVDAEWVIVTNTDIRIPDTGFVRKLTGVTGAAVVGPRIISGLSGQDQNPYLPTRPDAGRMRRYKWIFASHLRLSAYEFAARVKKMLQRRGAPDPSATARPIYAAHGSFLAFHRSYFAAGGSLQHPIFLFGEEILVAETARRLGLEVSFDPTLVVHHAEHATTSVFANKVVARHVAKASAWVADTYFANDP